MNIIKPLLSIYIPTYNGAESCLDLVLASATRIANQYRDIEVIVSDNCSIDETEQLCLKYKSICPHFAYYRNEENIGFNYNMLKVSEYAHGEFVWIIGDDDVIEYAYFHNIYEEIKKNEVDLVSIGFSSISKSMYYSTEGIIDTTIHRASFQEVIRDNCHRGNTLCTFIGCTIFRFAPFNNIPKDIVENKFDCDYNIFPNAYFLVNAFVNSSCAYITEPCVTCVDSGRVKSYEKSLKGWIAIDTKAIIELYNHFLEAGVKKEYLKETEDRIIYDFLIMGAKMRKNGYSLPQGFFRYSLKLFSHPHVLLELIKRGSNKLFKSDFTISI